jgi:ubiquinone/menaquinone biosynthesis C-methylase UbiE
MEQSVAIGNARPNEVVEEARDEVRARLHAMWESVAGGWEAHAAFVEERGAVVTAALLDLAQPKPGERVLELACGAGGLGRAAAERVGPSGEVVLSDVSPAMTAIARKQAEARGLGNVRTRVLDLEQIDEPDGAYDVVLCREGLMLVPDPARAAREMRRVLVSGGRLAVAVWGPREQNPWLGIVFDAFSAELGVPMPPPGIPGPFSLDDAVTLAGVLSSAGLGEVEVGEAPTPYRASSIDEWWTRTAELAGPLAQRLAALPERAAQALVARASTAISPYATSTGLEIPGVSLVARAVRN